MLNICCGSDTTSLLYDTSVFGRQVIRARIPLETEVVENGTP